MLNPYVVSKFILENPLCNKYSFYIRLDDAGTVISQCTVAHSNGAHTVFGNGKTIEESVNNLVWNLLHSEHDLLATLSVNESVSLIDDDTSALIRLIKEIHNLPVLETA